MTLMPVEFGKIREYALATGSNAPGYLDDDHAPVPPTFLSTVVLWDDFSELTRTETVAACRGLGLEPDWQHLLSLEQEYVFHGPLPRAGDVLLAQHRFDGVEIKQARSGRMVVVRFAVEFLSPDGPLRAECRYTSAFVDPVAVGRA